MARPSTTATAAHGERESVTIPGEGILSVSQFKWTTPASVTLPGGSAQNKAYDGLLNLEELKVKTPGQQTLLDLSNRYGKRQELTSRIRSDTVTGVTGTVSGSFSYDDKLRLTQSITDTGNVLGSDTETFTLDAVGNRTEHSRVTGPWDYDANNRLTDKGLLFDATRYDYDDAGNLTRKTKVGKATQYGYDTQNRLIEVKDSSDNLIARYGYDPFDRRIWKEQYRDKNGNVLVQARRSYYLYADEGLIAESRQDIALNADQTVSASAEPTIASQYGPRPDAQFTTGLLFVKTKNSNGSDTVAYYHHDHVDTPIQATDKNGNVVWSANYNVFGQATITTPTASLDKPTISSELRLPGQVEDKETGFHYNWHRYYDPGLGRYVTADPIGLLGGINMYAYVGGSPVNGVDPTGESAPIIACLANPWCRATAGAAAGALFDFAMQYWENDGNLECIDLNETGASAVMGGTGGVLLKGLSKLKGLGKAAKVIPSAKKANISTGRTTPNSLKEKLAMEEVKSNPSGYTPPRMPKMSDTKNNLIAEDGWVKRTQNVNGVEIHYVENVRTGEVVDFKFKD